MKLILTLIFLSAKFCVGQQAVIKEIRQKKPGTNKLYIFPKIIIPGNSSIALKINNTLQEDILILDTVTAENRIFDQVWGADGAMATVSDISYTVNYNKDNFLSLSISYEGCGAYCEAADEHFNFNLGTGNRLTLDSFFTEKGIQVLLDSLNNFKKRKLKNELAELRKEAKSKKIQSDKEEKERCKEMLSMYTDCLENTVDKEYIEYIKFTLTPKGMLIYLDRCSAHYNMAYDELWIFQYPLKLNSWKNYLSTSGRDLIKKMKP